MNTNSGIGTLKIHRNLKNGRNIILRDYEFYFSGHETGTKDV